MNRKILLFLSLLVTSATAQEEIVTTEILSLALDEPVAGLYFNNGKEIAIFQANLTGLGEPLTYKGPRRLLFRSSEAEFTAEPPLPPPAAFVDLPLNSDRILLVCVKTKDQPPKMIAYDIAKGRSGAGDYRFFNFSHSTISSNFGGKQFAVRPGADTIITDSSWKTEVLELDMELAIVTDGKAKPVYSSVWGHRPGRRSFIFMFDGLQSYKPIRICRFFDVPSIAKQVKP